MGEVYSHLSEEERQVIQIEVGNGASIRGIGAMLGRSPSSISREIKRNTWFPSTRTSRTIRTRPKRLKAGPWTVAATTSPGPRSAGSDRSGVKPRKSHRLSHDRLRAQVAEWLGAAGSRSPLLISGRLRVLWPDDALMRVCAGDHLPMGLPSRPLREQAGALPATRGHRRRRHAAQEDVALPDPR